MTDDREARERNQEVDGDVPSWPTYNPATLLPPLEAGLLHMERGASAFGRALAHLRALRLKIEHEARRRIADQDLVLANEAYHLQRAQHKIEQNQATLLSQLLARSVEDSRETLAEVKALQAHLQEHR